MEEPSGHPQSSMPSPAAPRSPEGEASLDEILATLHRAITDRSRCGPWAGWWLTWILRFLESFLRQWTDLAQHFLLVMWVLVFTWLIGRFLAWFQVGIQRHVQPILDITDVLLIG